MGREGLAAECARTQPQDRRRDEPRRDHGDADTPVSEIAEILERSRIKRVPIVKDGRLVGIVSRANLLHALASLRKEIAARPVADSELREAIMARLRSEPWIRSMLVNVTVADGLADVWGIVDFAFGETGGARHGRDDARRESGERQSHHPPGRERGVTRMSAPPPTPPRKRGRERSAAEGELGPPAQARR